MRGYCGAGEFVVPAHFILEPKAQAEETYYRGRVMKALKRPKDVAEDDLTLSIPQDTYRKRDEFNAGTGQVKKLPILL